MAARRFTLYSHCAFLGLLFVSAIAACSSGGAPESPVPTPGGAGCFWFAAAATPVQIAPSARSATIGELSAGSRTPVTARTATGWLQVVFAGRGAEPEMGWVFAPDFVAEGPCADLPVTES